MIWLYWLCSLHCGSLHCTSPMHSPAVAQLASHTGEWDRQILLYYESHALNEYSDSCVCVLG